MTTITKERPILFKSEMVRALLDGRKTQTRRVVKPQPVGDVPQKINCEWFEPSRFDRSGELIPGPMQFGFWSEDEDWKCPYGFPGERLWVKEKWRCVNWGGDYKPDQREVIEYADGTRREIGHQGDHTLNFENWCERIAWQGCEDLEKAGFRFDGFGRMLNEDDYPHDDPPIRWRPSIHMPRWASRITLEITGVRVERLQEISEEDAKSEGITRDIPFVVEHENTNGPFSYHFAALWDSINGKPSPIYERGEDGEMRIVRYESYPWSEASRDPRQEIKGVPHVCTPNPWNWVVEFKRIDN